MPHDQQNSKSELTIPASGFFRRLLLRIPAFRRLAEDNRKLRENLADSRSLLGRLRETVAEGDQKFDKFSSRVTELESALSKSKNHIAAQQAEIARLEVARAQTPPRGRTSFMYPPPALLLAHR